MPVIYIIENILTGKAYIGQTVDYDKRKREHINALRGDRHDNRYLQNSWNKYGESAFRFAIVAECAAEQLDELEIWYIQHLNTFVPSGYNLTKGGDGVRGLKWSPESCKAQSLAMKGKRTGASASMFGKTHTDETREKLRSSTTALWQNEDFRKRQVEAHTGKKQSEETKRKKNEALIGKTINKRAHRFRCVETGIEYESFGKIDLGFKVDNSAIHRACRRGIRAYGFHWEFADTL